MVSFDKILKIDDTSFKFEYSDSYQFSTCLSEVS